MPSFTVSTPMLDETAKNFQVRQVLDDKGYGSLSNYAAIEAHGGCRSNGRSGGLWAKMFRYFHTAAKISCATIASVPTSSPCSPNQSGIPRPCAEQIGRSDGRRDAVQGAGPKYLLRHSRDARTRHQPDLFGQKVHLPKKSVHLLCHSSNMVRVMC
jgi:hypothetical protein